MDRILSGATTPGQSGPGSDGNELILYVPQSSSITGTSPSDCLVSYLEHSLGESYSSAEKQSVNSTAPAERAMSIAEVVGMLRLFMTKKNSGKYLSERNVGMMTIKKDYKWFQMFAEKI